MIDSWLKLPIQDQAVPLTDKPDAGSSSRALSEQISPDLMRPKKHVRNAAHSIILSLVSGRASQVAFILRKSDSDIGSL